VRFAFMPVLGSDAVSWRGIADLWRAADDIEIFESGWLFDHFSPAAVGATGPCFEAWTAMTALAQVTCRLRLGTMVLAIGRRHPVLLAQMALTLDAISGGRVEIGLGAGSAAADHHAQGIELGTPAQRADRLDGGCATLVAHMSGLASPSCGIVPTQRPHPPICIGGNGEQRTLRIAARYAQHWNFHGRQVTAFTRKRAILRGYCVETGRNPDDIMVSATMAGSPGDVAVRAAEFAKAGADLGIIYMRPPYRTRDLRLLARALRPLATPNRSASR
jgi:alkanesulfonate monooxygenase SsuD/methylene tetrahydromethanopterin reductase-like flavin-dependent oxidoreductase (luciferase family)